MTLSEFPFTTAVIKVTNLVLQARQPGGVTQCGGCFIAGERRSILAGQRSKVTDRLMKR